MFEYPLFCGDCRVAEKQGGISMIAVKVSLSDWYSLIPTLGGKFLFFMINQYKLDYLNKISERKLII